MAQSDLFHTLWTARWALLSALKVTCGLAIGGMAIGLVLSTLGSIGVVFGPIWLRAMVATYVYVFRGVPLLVTIFFTYFGLAVVWRALPAELAGTVALGLYAAAQLTEIFRGALQAVPRGQIESAKALGLPFLLRLVDVIAPLSIRRALPSVINTMVDLIKASTLISTLGVGDLLLTGQQIAARTLLIPQIYITLWMFYLAINTGLTVLGRRLEERYRHVVY